MSGTAIRVGVDIGGTFTDVVLDTGNQLHSKKVLTTHAAPEDGIIAGVLAACKAADVEPAQITQVVHGTTLATNALIERRGAKTALVTTQGFRDVIEMRTESRFEQYDLNIRLPEPLLSRDHRYTLEERVDANGQVLIKIDAAAIEALANQLTEKGYTSVAVGFLHAYANSAHEQLVRKVFARCAPDLHVSLSAEVSPQMREYERFNTVVANAYIKPLIKSYLDRLRGRLQEIEMTCPVFLMHSGGGIISLESAAEFPVRLVESGPAGGAVFAADVAARYGLQRVLSFDMGGTTAKICLVNDQQPNTSRVFEVARSYRFKKGSGMPISIPVIDMVEIGAGGGSLATVDTLNQIRIGPESAGSNPGPACYWRGGKRPTVTDADLVLGKLDAEHFAGGSLRLDFNAAANALNTEVGTQLGVDAESAAFGVAEVVDENMANAARVHAIENGEDVTQFSMIAFGGAAPLHASRLCQKLGISQLLIPPGAGVGSAIGFLRAPFSFEASRSAYTALSAFDSDTTQALIGDLDQEATEFVSRCSPSATVRSKYRVYMRYVGQGWEIPVPLSRADVDDLRAGRLQSLFEHHYALLFNRTVSGLEIEVTAWSVNASTPYERPALVDCASRGAPPRPVGSRHLFDPAQSRYVDAGVFQRDQLTTGDCIFGPAVIVEDETTTVLYADQNAVCQADGCLLLTTAEGQV